MRNALLQPALGAGGPELQISAPRPDSYDLDNVPRSFLIQTTLITDRGGFAGTIVGLLLSAAHRLSCGLAQDRDGDVRGGCIRRLGDDQHRLRPLPRHAAGEARPGLRVALPSRTGIGSSRSSPSTGVLMTSRTFRNIAVSLSPSSSRRRSRSQSRPRPIPSPAPGRSTSRSRSTTRARRRKSGSVTFTTKGTSVTAAITGVSATGEAVKWGYSGRARRQGSSPDGKPRRRHHHAASDQPDVRRDDVQVEGQGHARQRAHGLGRRQDDDRHDQGHERGGSEGQQPAGVREEVAQSPGRVIFFGSTQRSKSASERGRVRPPPVRATSRPGRPSSRSASNFPSRSRSR